MGLLSSRGRQHLNGFKHLTTNSEIIEIKDKEVIEKIYIQVVAPNGKELQVLVNEGDEVKIGTKLTVQQDFYVPTYSPVSGKVIGKEMRFNSTVGRPVQHLVIENDFNDVWEENVLKTINYESASREEIIEAIKEAGIVGLGGSGFPTYAKYEGVENIDTVLINGVECEPFLTTDYFAMQNEREALLKGATLLKKAANANNVVIAFKKGKEAIKAKLLEIVDQYEGVSIVEVPDVYPMGWEKALIQQVFKKEYENLPSEAGIVVNNAQTAIAVAKALLEGKPITHRLVTVAGNAVKECANVVVPVGTPVSKIIEKLGGYTAESVYLLPGGPMTSKAQMNDTFTVTKNLGGLTVIERVNYTPVPCLRCGGCINNCPASLMPVEIKLAVEIKDVDRIKKLEVDRCIECGLCTYTCPSKIDVTEFMRKAKLQLKIAAAKAGSKK